MSREQKGAFTLLMQNINSFDNFTIAANYLQRNGTLLKTNFVAASYHPIEKTDIPCEANWCWNQSNAKVVIEIDHVTRVTFRKISTKKKTHNSAPAPSYKIWLYEIESLITQPQYFLWCEKGTCEAFQFFPSVGINTEIGTIYPESLSIRSFAFLRPFVEEQVAVEFGWYNYLT